VERNGGSISKARNKEKNPHRQQRSTFLKVKAHHLLRSSKDLHGIDAAEKGKYTICKGFKLQRNHKKKQTRKKRSTHKKNQKTHPNQPKRKKETPNDTPKSPEPKKNRKKKPHTTNKHQKEEGSRCKRTS